MLQLLLIFTVFLSNTFDNDFILGKPFLKKNHKCSCLEQYANRKPSFNNERHKNNALLSKYIWTLINDRKTPIIIKMIIKIGKIFLVKKIPKLIPKILFYDQFKK